MSWEHIMTLEGHSGDVYSVAFSPDGQYIASGGWDHTVKIWSTTTGECEKTMVGHRHTVESVTFSPDGRYLASGSFDRTVKLWSTVTRVCLTTLRGHSDGVFSVAFSPDGQYLASGSSDNYIKLWRVEEAREAQVNPMRHGGTVWSVAFSPDGRYLASGSGDNTVQLWRVANGAYIRTIEALGNDVFSVAFSPDGEYLVAGSKDRSVTLWRFRKQFKPYINTTEKVFMHDGRVKSIAYSPDGQYILAGDNSVLGKVKVWRSPQGAEKFIRKRKQKSAMIALHKKAPKDAIQYLNSYIHVTEEEIKEELKLVTDLTYNPIAKSASASSLYNNFQLRF